MLIAHYGIGIWDPGGVATYIRRVATAQRAVGHEVIFFDNRATAPDCPVSWQAEKASSDQDLFERAVKRGVDMLHLHSSVSCRAPATLGALRSVHTNEPYCPSGTQFRKRTGKPCVKTFGLSTCVAGHLLDHCGSLRLAALQLSAKRILQERRILPGFKALVDSEFVRQRMIASDYPSSKISVLPLMAQDCPDAVPPPRDGPPRFVFMGRLVPEKGLQWLLRAFAKLDLPCHLDIAGTGYVRADLEALAKQLGVGDRVQFHGWLDQGQLSALVSGARAIVVPSVWQEPGGTVTFEAMAQGRAVIVSKVGGAAEPVDDGVDGLLIEPADEAGLAAAMRRLADDVDLAWAMGRCGQVKVRGQYSLALHMKRLHQHYQTVLEELPSILE